MLEIKTGAQTWKGMAPDVNPVNTKGLTMDSLTVFNNNGIELVINEQTKEIFATQNGYARMSGLTKQAISKRIKGVNQTEIKTAEIQTLGGLQGVNLIPASLVFEWSLKDNLDLAKAMGTAGATAYLFRLAGYRIDAQLAEVSTPQSEQKVLPLSRETQAQLLLALSDSVKRAPNDRAELILQSQLINLVEVSQQAEPVQQLLSVTEVCALHGIKLPSGKDSVIGKKVANVWRLTNQSEPQHCKKYLDTGHCSEIKVYPTEFFERIITIAQEYLEMSIVMGGAQASQTIKD